MRKPIIEIRGFLTNKFIFLIYDRGSEYKSDRFYWDMKSRNGEIVSSSFGMNNLEACIKTIKSIIKWQRINQRFRIFDRRKRKLIKANLI